MELVRAEVLATKTSTRRRPALVLALIKLLASAPATKAHRCLHSTVHVRANRGREHATSNSTELSFVYVANATTQACQSILQGDESSEDLILRRITTFACGRIIENSGYVDRRFDTRRRSASRRGARDAKWRLRSFVCGSGDGNYNLYANVH